MSIRSQYIFDDSNEIVYDASLIEVVTDIDDPSLVNPFVSGVTAISGTVDGNYSSGYVTPSTFYEVVSGQPWVSSSGELVTFDFGSPRKLHSISIYQDPTRYAVDYAISGDNQLLVRVHGSTNSGTISHKLAQPFEAQHLTIGVFQINPQSTISGAPSYYEFIEVSGEANLTFVTSSIVMTDVAQLTATSVVEPVENLFDNNPLTFWQSNNSFPQTVIWKFKDNENVSRFHYIGEDNTTYPTQFQLYSSLDGTTYGLIASRDSSNPVTSGEALIDFAPASTAKYLKWVINAGVGAKTRIREVFIDRRTFPQFDANLIRMKKTTHNGLLTPVSLSASSQSGTAVVSNIVSTDTSLFWNSNANFASNSGTMTYLGSEYILVDLGTAATLDSAAWVNRDGHGVPIDYQLLGSNDNITYSTIDSITGNGQRTSNIDFTDTVNTFRFYKMVFTNSTDPFVRIHHAEINLRAYPSSAAVELPSLIADQITSFSADSTAPYPATDIKYILSVDSKKYWFNGSAWVASNGTLANSNPLDTLNNNLGTISFPENFKVALVPVFQSDTTDTASLSGVTALVANDKNSVFIPTSRIRIQGILTGFPANVQKPIELQVNLIRSVISLNGQTIGSAVQTFRSDNTGYFDFELPQTEAAVPAKARWAIHIPIFNFRTEQFTPAQSTISLADWIGGNFSQ